MKSTVNWAAPVLLFSLAAFFVARMFDPANLPNRILVCFIALGVLISLTNLLTRKKLHPVRVNDHI